jgi:hypothetical protein
MQIDTQSLTFCEVAPEGDVISLGLVDERGESRTLRLSLNQVGALAMTLPGLIDKALKAKFGDDTLRYAYPLQSWTVEQSSDPARDMVTLRTTDGFAICFSMSSEQQDKLGEALGARCHRDVPWAH